MNKKNIILITTGILLTSALLTGCTNTESKSGLLGIANPWTDCNKSYDCAKEIAGFNMPLKLPNYSVRAMKGMVEVNYSPDKNRKITIRKSTEDAERGCDNSGDYNEYPQKSVLTLSNGVKINLRKDDSKIYVMYFGAESGCFSARSEQGMSESEVKNIYETIAEVETSAKRELLKNIPPKK